MSSPSIDTLPTHLVCYYYLKKEIASGKVPGDHWHISAWKENILFNYTRMVLKEHFFFFCFVKLLDSGTIDLIIFSPN